MTVRGGVHPGQVHVKYIKKLFGTFTPTANLESQTNMYISDWWFQTIFIFSAITEIFIIFKAVLFNSM